MLLHGRRGVAEVEYSWHPAEAYLFSGDAAYVREGVATARGEVDIDAYAVWIGGEEVLDAYAKSVRKVRRADADHVAEGLGMFASTRVVPLMVELAVKKCEAAVAWLVAHMDLARPELEAIAKAGKKPGDAAKAILVTGGAKGARAAEANKPTKSTKRSKPKKITPAQIERAFGRLVDEVVAAVDKVRGKPDAEAAAWVDAATGYMEIRSTMMNEPATEYLGHFFMVDGIGLEKHRASAWDRLAPSPEESDRWAKVLEDEER